MTTLAPPAELCGHTWAGPLCVHPLEPRPITRDLGVHHDCILPLDHLDDEPTTSHRCRCGEATRED